MQTKLQQYGLDDFDRMVPDHAGGWFHHDDVVPAVTALEDRLRQADAEVEKLRADVVWAARNGVWYGANMARGYLMHSFSFDWDGDMVVDNRIDCDGTTASLLSAVRRAREGEI